MLLWPGCDPRHTDNRKVFGLCPWALWTAMAQSTGFPKNLHWCLCDDTIRIWQDCLKALMDVMCVRRTFVPGFIHSRTCQSGESHKIRTMCLKPESLAFRTGRGAFVFWMRVFILLMCIFSFLICKCWMWMGLYS